MQQIMLRLAHGSMYKELPEWVMRCKVDYNKSMHDINITKPKRSLWSFEWGMPEHNWKKE